MSNQTPPLQVAVYISGHGYGHYTRTISLLSILLQTGKYNFHIRTTSSLYEAPTKYAVQPTVTQTNPYQLDAKKSLDSLLDFDSSLSEKEETAFLLENHVQAIFSDAPSLPCLIGHSLKIPSILVTNFTFDSIFQAILNSAPVEADKTGSQTKIDEMTRQYGLAHAVIRLPGYIPFLFNGPQIIDAPMHFRKAKLRRSEIFAELGLQSIQDKKILLHCFGGQKSDAPPSIPKLPDGWACISQTIDHPSAPFYKIPGNVYMPDFIAACDVVIGKLGWGTCSEVIGNGFKPLIYVPRSAFVEEGGLLRWMQSAHKRIVRLDGEKYESSDWQEAVEEAYAMNDMVPEFTLDQDKNDAELIRIVDETLESAMR